MAQKKRKTSASKAKPTVIEPPPQPAVRELLSDPAQLAGYDALDDDVRGSVDRALIAAQAILRQDPSQLAPQLWGRLADQQTPALRSFLAMIVERAHGVLMPRTRSLPSPDSPLLEQLVGHDRTIKALALLPDGRLLSASEDGSLRIWDRERGTSKLVRGQPGPINSIALSSDHSQLATGSDNGTITLWSVKGPKKLGVLSGHGHHVRDVGFTSDGALVSASDDGSLRLWAIATQESRVVAQYRQAITAMAVSPVERRVAVATMDNALRLVELDDGRERILYDCTGNFIGTVMGASLAVENRSAIGHHNFAKALCFSPDGRTLYSVEDSLIAWDVHDGTQRRRWRGHSWPIEGLALDSGGERVATAAESVVLWDVAREHQRDASPPARLLGHPEGATAVAFAADGASLWVGYEDGPIKRWDLSRPTTLASSPGHLRNVWSLALAPDGRTLASGGADRAAIVWDLETGGELGRIDGFEDVFVHALAWSPDGRRLYASSGRDLLEWDAVSRTLVGKRRWAGGPSLLARSLVGLADGRVLVAGYGAGLLCWSAAGEPSFWPGYRKDRNTTALVVSADGSTAYHAVYQDDRPGTVRCWDLGRQALVGELATPGEYINELALSDSGRFLVGGGSLGGVYVWATESGELCHQLERHAYMVTNLVALPGDRLLSCASEGPVREWDLDSGALRRQLAVLERQDGLCVSRDGARLASRRQQTVGLFDLEREAWLASFTVDGSVDHLRLSPDGETVIVGERAGAISILRFVP
ncbi:MAG TPA: WD40 repeat domain-containing protein [Enhygromyxa sp.]|nr:WD40 repeat domain-containing protein [Enhygromyxa sp.]